MQTSLILLFLFSLVMAGISFYIGFMRPQRPGTWLSKAGFIIWLFLLAPFLAYVLYQQSGSVERLEKTGFIAPPSMEESVGLACGTGSEPTWMFKAKGDPDSILTYYRSPETRPGWTLVAETPQILSFVQGEKRMDIFASEGWGSASVMYKLSAGSD
ncbi:MAG: hypothetical protein RRA32_02030 [bacterium]|nr:hypothetical protein [bacterium]